MIPSSKCLWILNYRETLRTMIAAFHFCHSLLLVALVLLFGVFFNHTASHFHSFFCSTLLNHPHHNYNTQVESTCFSQCCKFNECFHSILRSQKGGLHVSIECQQMSCFSLQTTMLNCSSKYAPPREHKICLKNTRGTFYCGML